jgi:hypothetical protein
MLEKQVETRSQLRRALAYPVIVLGMVGAALTVIVGFVVPKFAATFASGNRELPLATKIVQAVGASMQGYWWAYLGGLFTVLITLALTWRNPKGRLVLEAALLKIPYVCDVISTMAAARFSRVLGISLASGLDVTEAIEIAGRSTGRPIFVNDCAAMSENLRQGERLIDTLTGREKLFEQTEFDDRVRMIVREARVPIGIYVEKGFEKLDRVVVPLFALGDSPLLTFAQKLVHNNGTSITFVDLAGVFEQSPEMLAVVRGMEAAAPDHVRLISQVDLNEAALKDQDLMLIGLDSWRRSVEKESPWLGSAPSMLIMRP